MQMVQGGAIGAAFGTPAHGLPVRIRSNPNHDAGLGFRNYQVLPEDRLLLRDGEPVEIGGRAFDMLVVLLRSRGSVVSKNDIVEHVWPSTLVEESNLRFQMACLRRSLGHDRDVIKTVKGRGYLLAADGVAGRTHESGSTPIEGPVLDGDLSDLPVTDREEVPPSSGEGHPIVAVIDDDDDTREALDGLLRSTGMPVESFKSVKAFLDSGRRSRVECLVLDVWMPGQSGLDFQDDMVASGIHLPVIFISGHADVHMSVRAMKAGAVEFFTKPVRHEDLLGAIQSVMAGTNART